MADSIEVALHNNALDTLEQADRVLAHATGLNIDEPHEKADITTDLIERVLGAEAPGAKLVSLKNADAHDGMTSRQIWRLQWNDAGMDCELPASVFVKCTPDGEYLKETLSMLHMAENEVRFYNQIQPELSDIAPSAYYARSYPGGRFMILMEVLEDRGLRPYWMADECTLEHAKAVTTALANLHAQYWQTERFTSDLAWVRPRTRRFGFNWHQNSFLIARNKYLESDFGKLLPQELVELVQLWERYDQDVLRHWEKTLPSTVLHGDSHLGNTFSYPDGRAGYFDWQVIYRGNGLRDLAYFFLTAVQDELRREHEREIVQFYTDEINARGVPLTFEDAWDAYCIQSIDRLDAHMKTYTRGGYGHAQSAIARSRQTIVNSLHENDVLGRLKSMIDRIGC